MAELEGRVLGLDLGDVRIGVAISDPERRLAVPLGTVHTGAPADLKAVAARRGMKRFRQGIVYYWPEQKARDKGLPPIKARASGTLACA